MNPDSDPKRTQDVQPGTLRRSLVKAAIAASLLPNRVARASGPVSLLVAYAPGGAADTGARLIAPALARRLDRHVIVENVPGAGGALGVQRALRAAPDGQVLLFGTVSEAVLVPLFNRNVQLAAETLIPLASMGSNPVAFIAPPGFAGNHLDDLIDQAKRRPGKLSYGSPGIGTIQHLAAEVVKDRTGAFATHLPYRGAQPVIADVMAGQLDFGVVGASTVAPLAASGKLKLLAISSAERLKSLPSTPSFGDMARFKGLDLQVWAVLFAPPGTPADLVSRLHAVALDAAFDSAIVEVRERSGGVSPLKLGPKELLEFVNDQRSVYRSIARRIKVDLG